jgi:tRNA G10  N-methylase Trm11
MHDVVQIGNAVTLICGDNASALAALPADYAVVTDPPYGIGYKHGGGGRGKHSRRVLCAVPGDDRPFDPAP